LALLLKKITLKISKQFLILYAVLGIFIILTSTYSIITPAFEGPDESTHFIIIENFKEGKFLEEDFRKENLLPLPYMIYSLFLQFFDYDKTDIPTNWPVRIVKDTEVHNRFLHFEEENFPFSGTASAVHFLRFVSIAAGIAILFITFKISKWIFPQSEYLPLFPVALVAFMPKFSFMFAVINTEVFLVLFSILSFYFMLKFLKNTSQSNLILMSVFSGFAVFSKINGILVILIILVAFLILFLSKKISRIDFIKKFLIFVGITIIAGGWYKIFKNLIVGEIYQISAEPFKIFGDPTRPPPTLFQIKHRLFDTIWTDLGWGSAKVVTVDGFLFFVSIILIISIVGIIFLFIKRKKLLPIQVEKSDLIMMLSIVIIFFLGLAYMVLVYNAANGRNVLAILPFVSIGIILGLNGFLNGKKIVVLVIPICAFLFFSFMHFQVIEEDLRYDFGNKYPYNLIINGHGTHSMGSARTAIQHGFLEGGQESIYLFLHPDDGQTWWNYTIPIDEKINTLKYYYGFAVSPIRSLPVEFSVYVNGEKVFSDKKYYTCTLGYFEKNLEKYKGDDVEISLATDGLGDNYAAWAIWKPVLDDEELFLIKPTHPEISKTWVSSEYDLHPCES